MQKISNGGGIFLFEPFGYREFYLNVIHIVMVCHFECTNDKVLRFKDICKTPLRKIREHTEMLEPSHQMHNLRNPINARLMLINKNVYCEGEISEKNMGKVPDSFSGV